jgi:hypothetical protein
MTRALRERDPRRLGGYELTARLGEGGMGAVYLGHGPDGRQVAVKVIKPEYTADAELRERFRREVAAAGLVARFCTAQVLDADLDAGQPYIVSEYVEGPTLTEVVGEHGPLSPSGLEALAVGIAGALNSIHAGGVVHRDLKPGNVLLSTVGPRVIDFGIARAAEFQTGLTATRRQPGTPAFMAPEQHEGKQAGPAADIFAWGGVIAFAGTGRLPFGEGSGASVAYRVVFGEPDLEGLDPRMAALVREAMAKDPARRPDAAGLLRRLIGAAGDPRAAMAQVLERDWDPGGALTAGRRTGPGPAVTWAVGLGAGLVVAIAAWLALSLAAATLGWTTALILSVPLLALLGWLAGRPVRPAPRPGSTPLGPVRARRRERRRRWLRVVAGPACVLTLAAAGLAAAGPTRSPLVPATGPPVIAVPDPDATAPAAGAGGGAAPSPPARADSTGDPLQLADDFATTGAGWRESSGPAFAVGRAPAAGALRLRTKANFPSDTAPARAVVLDRAHVRLDVRLASGTSRGTLTINCRRTVRDDYYYFDVAMDGRFSIHKFRAAGSDLPPGDIELRRGALRLNGDGFNRIEATCAGHGPVLLTLSANGSQVTRVADEVDPIPGPGRISLGAYSPEVPAVPGTWTELLVDNFALWGTPS